MVYSYLGTINATFETTKETMEIYTFNGNIHPLYHFYLYNTSRHFFLNLCLKIEEVS
jgi:hypothetical protein